MKLISTLVLLIAIARYSDAQSSFLTTDSLSGDNNQYYSGIEVSDGYVGVGISSYPQGTNKANCFISKIDLNGNLVYAHTWNFGVNTMFNDVIALSNGNLLVAGSFFSDLTIDYDSAAPFLCEIDKRGDIVSFKKYLLPDAALAGKIILKPDSSLFLLCGYTNPYSFSYEVKLELTKDRKVTKSYDISPEFYFISMYKFVPAGTGYLTSGPYFYAMLDSTLKVVKSWYDKTKNIYVNGAVQDDDGNTIVVYARSDSDLLHQNKIRIKKVGKNDSVIWNKSYSALRGKDLSFMSIKKNENNSILVVAYSSIGDSTAYQNVVFKIDSLGNIIWINDVTNGNIFYSPAPEIFITQDGGFLLSGIYSGLVYPVVTEYPLLAKLNSRGELPCLTNPDTLISKNVNDVFNDTLVFSYQSFSVTDTTVTPLPSPGNTPFYKLICFSSGLNTEAGTLKSSSYEFSLFPDPVGDELTVDLNSQGAVKNFINIYNITGQKVFGNNILGGNSTLDVNFLASGVYILEVSDSGGNTCHKKFIKL